MGSTLTRAAAAVAAALAAALGCDGADEQCEVGASRCEGDQHLLCMSMGPGSDVRGWVTTDCTTEGQVCREADGQAACVLPEGGCPETMLAVCVEGSVYDCLGMGLVLAWECEAACVEFDDYAFCALDTEPCPPGVEAFCDDRSLVTCSTEGYPVEQEDCSADGLGCVENGATARCE